MEAKTQTAQKQGKFTGQKKADKRPVQTPPTLAKPETPSAIPATAGGTPTPTPAASAEKTKRKASEQVQRWKDTPTFKPEQKITVIATENPKRRTAAKRFDLYKNGQTVAEYVEASKKAGNAAALANADIRWDHAAGFIKVA
jgi:hypothetical protein